jgi:hypothetical protein
MLQKHATQSSSSPRGREGTRQRGRYRNGRDSHRNSRYSGKCHHLLRKQPFLHPFRKHPTDHTLAQDGTWLMGIGVGRPRSSSSLSSRSSSLRSSSLRSSSLRCLRSSSLRSSSLSLYRCFDHLRCLRSSSLRSSSLSSRSSSSLRKHPLLHHGAKDGSGLMGSGSGLPRAAWSSLRSSSLRSSSLSSRSSSSTQQQQAGEHGWTTALATAAARSSSTQEQL